MLPQNTRFARDVVGNLCILWITRPRLDGWWVLFRRFYLLSE